MFSERFDKILRELSYLQGLEFEFDPIILASGSCAVPNRVRRYINATLCTLAKDEFGINVPGEFSLGVKRCDEQSLYEKDSLRSFLWEKILSPYNVSIHTMKGIEFQESYPDEIPEEKPDDYSVLKITFPEDFPPVDFENMCITDELEEYWMERPFKQIRPGVYCSICHCMVDSSGYYTYPVDGIRYFPLNMIAEIDRLSCQFQQKKEEVSDGISV